MSEYIQPFDFKEIFLNTFLGGTELFYFALIFIYSLVAAKVQMSGRLYITILLILSLFFATTMGQILYTVYFLFLGLFIFKVMSKILS